jgi:hypothetical protein
MLAALALAPGTGAGTGEPSFRATISRIGPALRDRMTGKSWHRGCPVPLRNLRLIRLTYWGFDREAHAGYLVVKRGRARQMRTVMRTLYETRFPIRRMRLIDRYDASDRRSMNANNTSAFNCRFVSGTTRWSEHAYGRAIDINPIQNPYVSGGVASPAAGQAYVDRSRRRKGMIRGGGRVVRAFASVGWEWGGYWSSPRDYQHFSSRGR